MTNSRYMKPKLSGRVSDLQQVALVKLMEECAETSHACAKILRHGWAAYNPDAPVDGNNRFQLLGELNDLADAAAALVKLDRGLQVK